MHNTSFALTFCPHYDLVLPKVILLIVPRKIENITLRFWRLVLSGHRNGDWMAI